MVSQTAPAEARASARASPPPAAGRPPWRPFATIGAKLIAAVALSMVAGSAIMIGIMASMQEGAVRNMGVAGDALATTLLAEQMAGAVRWRKTDMLEAVALRLDAAEGSRMSSMMVHDAAGELLASYASPRLAPFDLGGAVADAQDALQRGESHVQVGDGHTAVVTPIRTADGATLGSLALAWDLGAANRNARSAMQIQLALAAGVVIATLGLLVILLRSIVTRPIDGMAGAMSRLVAGDQDVDIPGTARRDEIGAMARALEIFRDNARDDGAPAGAAGSRRAAGPGGGRAPAARARGDLRARDRRRGRRGGGRRLRPAQSRSRASSGTMHKLARGHEPDGRDGPDRRADLAGMLAALAEGDLGDRIVKDYQGQLGELKTNANQPSSSSPRSSPRSRP